MAETFNAAGHYSPAGLVFDATGNPPSLVRARRQFHHRTAGRIANAGAHSHAGASMK
jgi:hypothetical protein